MSLLGDLHHITTLDANVQKLEKTTQQLIVQLGEVKDELKKLNRAVDKLVTALNQQAKT